MLPVPECLGLQQPPASRVGTVRKASVKPPQRSGKVWESVNVTREHGTSPELKCKNCSATFCGGATRIVQHIVEKCSGSTHLFLALKEELLGTTDEKAQAKRQKTSEEEVMLHAEEEEKEKTKKPEQKKRQSYKQVGIHSSIIAHKSTECDDAIAEMWYGLNLLAAKIEHPLVRKAFTVLKYAPASYVLPTQHRMNGDLLESTTSRLRNEEKSVRENMLKYGCTIISDGWDTIVNEHLINVLVGVNSGAFFEGTYKLKSTDAEDAPAIAKLIIGQISRICATSVVQVCTDTCAVMQAAWKLVERKFPWITCTCCGPHVLSLYLKDIGSIKEVEHVITKVSKVLMRFWGKTRWPRAKLREMTAKNHGKEIGLYRAKVTRFAGKVREMGRILRLKSDLQQIVVTSEYSTTKFKKTTNNGAELDHTGGTILGANDLVKVIILDEEGFWKPLVAALKIMVPIVKLLRLMDGNAPAMGKIYPKMAEVRKHIESSSISWKVEALRAHDRRWAYLKSDMHLAGYALDPEYMENHMNDEVQTALITVTERMALRSEVNRLVTEGDPEAFTSLTIESDCVQKLAGDAMMQLATYQDQEGVFGKQFVRKHAKEMPPAKWWDKYGKAVPLLCSVACSVLAQPVCASAAERNWSIYGSIKNEKRTRLKHTTSDCLVYCHEALHLRIKLQKSGYKEPTVKWESDSDDDDSSDEEDLMF